MPKILNRTNDGIVVYVEFYTAVVIMYFSCHPPIFDHRRCILSILALCFCDYFCVSINRKSLIFNEIDDKNRIY